MVNAGTNEKLHFLKYNNQSVKGWVQAQSMSHVSWIIMTSTNVWSSIKVLNWSDHWKAWTGHFQSECKCRLCYTVNSCFYSNWQYNFSTIPILTQILHLHLLLREIKAENRNGLDIPFFLLWIKAISIFTCTIAIV